MEAIEVTPEMQEEMIKRKKEEIAKIIQFSPDEFKQYLRNSISAANNIVQGFEHTDAEIQILDSILFVTIFNLRECVNNTLQWLDKHTAKNNKSNKIETDLEL